MKAEELWKVISKKENAIQMKQGGFFYYLPSWKYLSGEYKRFMKRLTEEYSITNKRLTMNVKDIIKKYLEDNGFTGLWNEEECGCSLDDLFICDGDFNILECRLGYKVKSDDPDHGGWMIAPYKEK